MSLFDTGTPAYFMPRRAIGGFEATITIEEASTDELEITQHPVQQGASITDHAYNKPSVVRIKAMWNDDDAPLAETYQNLLDLLASREPFVVITGKRTYRNMLFKSLGVTTDSQTENVLSVSAELQEIFITALEVVTVPERKKQADPGKTGKTENAGAKKAAPVDDAGKKRSALKALAGG